jgi:hypothetical protein
MPLLDHSPAVTYARDVAAADFKEAGDGDIVRTVAASPVKPGFSAALSHGWPNAWAASSFTLARIRLLRDDDILGAKIGQKVKAKRKDKNFAEWAHVQNNGIRRRARFPLLRLNCVCPVITPPHGYPKPAGAELFA